MGGQAFGSSGVPQLSEPPIWERIGCDAGMPLTEEPVAIPEPTGGGAAMVPYPGAVVCAIASGEKAKNAAARTMDRMVISLTVHNDTGWVC
ncbi:MAG: hypothetical protein JSS43_19025, partial [Proteobacteria bacterium]|nr:hypothetical protein [Pseudomonadota bacterium]